MRIGERSRAMSSVEHLIENGLIRVSKKGVTYDSWMKRMEKDTNWEGNVHVTLDELWLICQYVKYTWKQSGGAGR